MCVGVCRPTVPNFCSKKAAMSCLGVDIGALRVKAVAV